jgi:trans-2,3-dihydro-3-hydroxyanthranilate isomerase
VSSLIPESASRQPDGVTLPFWVVDVFTDAAFAGNPLAVVGGGEDLSTQQCQALARQFNLSETTFPIRSDAPGADYRLRIFTPASELPFAGHPSVGTAWLLAGLGVISGSRVVQECGAGLIPLDLDAGASGAVQLHSGPLEVSAPIDADPLLAAVGLSAQDLADFPPRLASAGLPFAYLMVQPGAIERAKPDHTRLNALPDGATGVSVFEVSGDTRGAADELGIRARVLAADVGEDPATGSAALGLAPYLAASGLVPAEGARRYVIRQGEQIGRPSRLECEVTVRAGAAVSATVRGRSVLVSTGRIAVPSPARMR